MKTEAKQITSKFLSLQMRDIIKGFLVAALTPVFTIITNSLSNGELTFNWKAIGTTALAAGLAYIAKNLFEPTKTVIIVEPPLEKGSGEKTVTVSKV